MSHDNLRDEQIYQTLQSLDDSDGPSDGEDDLLTYNPHRLLTSDSESESDSSEHAHLDLRDEGPCDDEDIAVPSPSFPPPEISSPPPLRRRGPGRRPSRGLTRGRMPSKHIMWSNSSFPWSTIISQIEGAYAWDIYTKNPPGIL